MLRLLKSKVFLGLMVMTCSVALSNCTVHHHHTHKHRHGKGHLPPGQAKKISGDKSARRHAPGHNK
jgi:hypothetical protein